MENYTGPVGGADVALRGDITLPGGGTHGLNLIPAGIGEPRNLLNVEIIAGPNDIRRMTDTFALMKHTTGAPGRSGRGAIAFTVPKSPYLKGFSTDVLCEGTTHINRVTKMTGKIPINGAGGFELVDFNVSRDPV
ncbi:hypothetical protein H3146_04440 [Streptomyces sp. OF3]|uniref:Uncharacterized protein n=1 Tax=Streptomyces alkaliterrae TaxID=2213162 RepID=A0A7W3WHT3_9ACTN|nr:hypothetical protein [Streptomyces alkaliterrae]MBB1252621.1 hypothetical protein [Streptomyces alkaliterrae]